MSISLKSKNDIEKMKIAGNYAAKVLEYLEDFAVSYTHLTLPTTPNV